MNHLAIINSAPPEVCWADKVALLAYRLSKLPTALVEPDAFEVKHRFKDIWYIREFSLPADCTFVGRTHKLGHIVKLLQGSANLLGPEGSPIYCAPAMIHTVPGYQTVAYTITPILAQSWHLNLANCRDIDELENMYFGSPQAVLERGEQLEQEALTWSAQLQLQ